MTLWQWNRLVNAIVLLAVVVLLGLLAFMWVRAYTNAAADPHGYTMIFGAIAAVLLLPPLLLLVGGALQLRRHQRSGFGFQIAAGIIVGIYGAVIPSTPPRLLGLGLGIALVTVGVLGLRAPVAAYKPESRDL
jgi:hypothetical protein